MSDEKKTPSLGIEPKSMMLYPADWYEVPSFRLMPISLDCPYIEAIFDRTSFTLVAITKNAIKRMQLLPRLDGNGEVVECKANKKNGKSYKEERVVVDTFQEHYIKTEGEIIAFIEAFGINADSFDYRAFFQPVEESKVITDPKEGKILSTEGAVLSAEK